MNLLPYLRMPFAFFGHSMGALVGFELARKLMRDHNLSPVHLFVSGCSAPQMRPEHPVTYNLPDEELIEDLRRLEGTPGEVLEHPELLRLMLPLIRADFSVCQTYTYEDGARLGCPITAYTGIEDRDVTRQSVEAWGEQTTGRFVMRTFPGGHFFLNTSESVVLRMLWHELENILRRLG